MARQPHLRAQRAARLRPRARGCWPSPPSRRPSGDSWRGGRARSARTATSPSRCGSGARRACSCSSSTRPLFFQHLTVVVPPAALLVARYRPPLAVGRGRPAAGRPGARRPGRLASHASGRDPERGRGHRPPATRGAARTAEVISDEPALGWLAGRTSPGSMVDLSYVRIQAGDLTTADVVAAARRARRVRGAAVVRAPRAAPRPASRARATTSRCASTATTSCCSATAATCVAERRPEGLIVAVGLRRSRLILQMRPTVDQGSTFRPRPCTSTLRRTPGGS